MISAILIFPDAEDSFLVSVRSFFRIIFHAIFVLLTEKAEKHFSVSKRSLWARMPRLANLVELFAGSIFALLLLQNFMQYSVPTRIRYGEKNDSLFTGCWELSQKLLNSFGGWRVLPWTFQEISGKFLSKVSPLWVFFEFLLFNLFMQAAFLENLIEWLEIIRTN